jgi:hypothetical protein
VLLCVVAVPIQNVMFANTDRASNNDTAVEDLMPAKDIRAAEDVITHIPCLDRTLNNSGCALQAKTVHLKKYMSRANKVFKLSWHGRFERFSWS